MAYVDPAWKIWYQCRHVQCCFLSGAEFERYVTSLFARYHKGFINPDPMGWHGDGGCDGLAENGSILYSCYGARAKTKIDQKVRDKLESDFARGLACWDSFNTWIFVTNSDVGPMAAHSFTTLQQRHGQNSNRPISLELWRAPEDLWQKIVNKLSFEDLDQLFPGVPQAQNVELADLIELIQALEKVLVNTGDHLGAIRPVPETKMDYNKISEVTRLEFNVGRILAPRIDEWFSEQADPHLRDTKAQSFQTIYDDAAKASSDATEIIESIYIAVGGSDFRMSTRRANAVYALTSYFFDSCDIFEEPPLDYGEGGLDNGIANQGN